MIAWGRGLGFRVGAIPESVFSGVYDKPTPRARFSGEADCRCESGVSESSADLSICSCRARFRASPEWVGWTVRTSLSHGGGPGAGALVSS